MQRDGPFLLKANLLVILQSGSKKAKLKGTHLQDEVIVRALKKDMDRVFQSAIMIIVFRVQT